MVIDSGIAETVLEDSIPVTKTGLAFCGIKLLFGFPF